MPNIKLRRIPKSEVKFKTSQVILVCIQSSLYFSFQATFNPFILHQNSLGT